MLRLRTTALTVLVALAAAVSTTASAAPAASRPTPPPQVPSQNATFGIQPAGAKAIDSRSAFQYTATPGSTLTDYAAVTNYSAKPLDLTVRSADAANTPQGGFALLGAESGTPKDVGAWVDLPASEQTLHLKARSRAILKFRVSIPGNAGPGDHIGGLQVTLDSFVTSKSGQKLKLVQSVGARMYVRISGPLHPKLTIGNIHASFGGPFLNTGHGHVDVSFVISNTGNVALGAIPAVHVSGLLGSVEQMNIPHLQLLLPGYSVTMKTTVRGVLPQVFMRARVTAVPLALPGTTQKLPETYEASGHFWAIPWLLLIALVLLIAIAVYAVRRRRAKRRAAAAAASDGKTHRQDESKRLAGGRHK